MLRHPPPRILAVVRLEPPQQLQAGVDRGKRQAAAQLLLPPALQHGLEHLRIRP
jgi:hypothetical protein